MPEADRGSAAVEFALVLPVLLVVALGLLQVGLVLRDQLLVAQSARAGAREAAVTDAQEEIRRAALLAAPGLAEEHVDVAVSRSGSIGTPVTVTVHYDVPVTVPFVEWLFPAPVSLAGEATMRQEFSS